MNEAHLACSQRCPHVGFRHTPAQVDTEFEGAPGVQQSRLRWLVFVHNISVKRSAFNSFVAWKGLLLSGRSGDFDPSRPNFASPRPRPAQSAINITVPPIHFCIAFLLSR